MQNIDLYCHNKIGAEKKTGAGGQLWPKNWTKGQAYVMAAKMDQFYSNRPSPVLIGQDYTQSSFINPKADWVLQKVDKVLL